MIEHKYKIHLIRYKIHKVLLEQGLAKQIGMKIRKKKWVRYERRRSLTVVHIDRMYDQHIEKQIVAVIDYASRMILAYGLFDSANTENTVLVLKQALEYGKIRQVITITVLNLLLVNLIKKEMLIHNLKNFARRKR
jgi:hypothetical protein